MTFVAFICSGHWIEVRTCDHESRGNLTQGLGCRGSPCILESVIPEILIASLDLSHVAFWRRVTVKPQPLNPAYTPNPKRHAPICGVPKIGCPFLEVPWYGLFVFSGLYGVSLLGKGPYVPVKSLIQPRLLLEPGSGE